METNKTIWEIRCPECGGRIYYKAPKITFEKGTVGNVQRVSRFVQCPECKATFTEMVLHSWIESKRNFGVIIEDD